MSESIFDKVAKSRATQGGAYIQPGDYLLTIEKCKLNDGHKGVSFAVEFVVDEATAKTDQDEKPNSVGARCSAVHNMRHDSSPGNIKAFILAAFGIAESEVTPADFAATMQDVVSDKQPLRGVQVRNSTFPYTTKAGLLLAALNNFSHVKQTEEQVAARRKALDSGTYAAEAEAEQLTLPLPSPSPGLSKFRK